MNDLHLIVTIAGERVALPAATIESVIEVAEAIRVPRAAAHVAGLAALRSRVITLIDSRVALGLPPLPEEAHTREAVVIVLDQHCYGLLVDVVEDVADAVPADAALAVTLLPVWARVACGMVLAGDELLPAIDPARLIAGPAAQAA